MTLLQHLHCRYMNTDLHRVWLNEDEGVAVFPIWNLSDQLVGYQQYRPDGIKVPSNNPLEGRYFTRIKDGKVGVWGLESWNLSNTLFVTEGIFDACRLTNHGYSAICVFGNDVSKTAASWLWMVRQTRCVVAVCDNDAAGRRLAKYGHVSHVVEAGDLGDATDEYVADLVKEYG
jgi:hypothetical protein